MDFRVLGPLEAIDGDAKLALGGPRQRLVLAYLLLEANRVVPTDRLIDRIWGDEPPDAARDALFAYISRLRKLLGPGRIQARPPGYVLVAERSEIDALRFADLIDEARRQSKDRAGASTLLSEALDLWRGGALSDLAEHDALRPAITRLEELRLGALEDRIEADMELGRHRETVPVLEGLTTEHPLRERLWSQLMLALYRSGRQGDALGAFHRARTHLVEELGIDPSQDLRRLHEQVLNQDPALDLDILDHSRDRTAVNEAAADLSTGSAAASGEDARLPSPTRGRFAVDRRMALAIGTLGAVAVVGGLALLLGDRAPSASLTPVPNSVLRIDPASGAITNVLRVGTKPAGLASGEGSIWVANFDDKTVQPISSSTAETGAPFGGFPGNPVAVAVGGGSVWVGVGFPSGHVLRVDRTAHNAVVPVGDAQTGLENLAYGEDALWITNSQANVLTRVDPHDPTRTRQLEMPDAGLAGVAVAPGAIWVAERFKRAVVEIDPETLTVRRTIEVLSGEPGQVAFGEGYVWVTNTTADAVIRIDPAPNGRSTTFAMVGNGPLGIAAGEGDVWVANGLDRTVVRIDPDRGTVIGSISLPAGVSPFGVVIGGAAVWVSLQGG